MLFSRFTDPFEKRIYKFFHKISTKSDFSKTQKTLINFMQEDLIRTNLLLEWKFKGYTKLTKKQRKKCYQNAAILTEDFLQFVRFYEAKELEAGQSLDPEKYLDLIRQYLHPNRNLSYRAGASFQHLLRNPDKERLVGDCNQITTLYLYLYSLRFPLTDLRLKVPEGHVCLHFQGEDLETTSGTWMLHPKYKRITSVSEIIPINLLDVPDTEESQHNLTPQTRLKAAELAFCLSKERKLAQHNLRVASHNCALEALEQEHFKRALSFARKAKHPRLIKKIIQKQGLHALKTKSFPRARKYFQQINSQSGLRSVDQHELQHWLNAVSDCKTIKDYRTKRTELKKIRKLAKTLKRKKILSFCDSILKQL